MVNRIRDFYDRARKPTTFFLVVVSVGTRFTPYPQMSYATLIALGLIVLQVLFEIHSKQEVALAAEWTANFHDAIPRMRAAIEERAGRRRGVRVAWWGVTLEIAWPVIQNLLSASISHGRPCNLKIELAILSPKGSTAEREGRATQKRLADMIERINEFKESNADQLTKIESTLDLFTYDFIPQAHVLLLDDDLAFWSYGRPLDENVMGPEGGVAVVRAESGPEAADRIRSFQAWMHYLRTT